MNNREKWFQGKKWGLFTHYLATPAGDGKGDSLSANEWNERINNFNVPQFARQLKETGADYFCITIGQNSGHYCSPNSTYDKLTEITPSKLSTRDLPLELADELAKYGVDMWVYLPSGAPCSEHQACEKLGWEWGAGYKEKTANTRLGEFQHNWQDIIKEWSLRWGEKVKGWWIDGCYYPDDMYYHDDAPNYKSFAAAIRSGNPNAVIAFNRGLDKPFEMQSDYDDYTAGEIGYEFHLAIDWDDTKEGITKKLDGRKLHVLSYLGKTWGSGEPRLPDELAVGYSKYIMSKGGIITWDIPLLLDGSIPKSYHTQLAAIGNGLRV